MYENFICGSGNIPPLRNGSATILDCVTLQWSVR